MKYIYSENGVFGPFSSVETHSDRFLADGTGYQFSVIGAAHVSELVPTRTPTYPTVKEYTTALQAHLDRTAQDLGYDSILSACTYALSNVPKFATEGSACIDWRDAFWASSYDIMTKVQQGLRPQPTIDELIAELPKLAGI